MSKNLLKEARDMLLLCTLIDKSDNCDKMVKKIDEYLTIDNNWKASFMADLNFMEIESLVNMKHFEDLNYGNSKEKCDELIEKTREKVGYTKKDLIKYKNKFLK